MKAVACTHGELAVVDVPTPVPGPGQLLLEVVRCGICGSDLHARRHCDTPADRAAELGYADFMRSDQSVVMGHEFSGVVLERGPGTRSGPRPGTPVVSFPVLRHGTDVHLVGLSQKAPGGYAEQVVVQAAMMLPIPNGLSPELAAFTEPLAVARHAVRRGRVGRGEVAVVVGCGPIGLAVVLMLKAAGVQTVVASDYSAGRRALALRCGADVVVDPAEQSPFDAYGERKGHLRSVTGLVELGIDTMQQLRAVPLLPWWHVFRAAERLGASPRGPVVFECVGVPGIIDQVIGAAPLLSRVVVVGVCMEPDTFRPSLAINKEIELRFVLGYDPGEFRDTLHLIADGTVDPSPLLTGTVGLAGVAAAFEALADPEQHAKILVDPRSDATTP